MSLAEFEIGKELGKGAFSSVYLVKRKEDNKIYAMKRVKIIGLGKKEKDNVFNEVNLLSSLNHKNIIGFYESFFDIKSETLNIILEFADDGDLSTKIKQNIKNQIFFDEITIWKTLIQILEGLKYLHKKCIIHRDLKSANIFLTKNGFVKIGDLNVSKIITTMGMANTQTGTPYFAAPEIWNNNPYDYKCDIWSVGCIIYEMAVLKTPFRGASMKQLYNKVMKGIYPSLPNRYSDDLKKIIKKILVVNPKNRPSANNLLNCDIIKRKINEYNFFFNNENLMEFTDNERNLDLVNNIKISCNMNIVNKKFPTKNCGNEKRQNLDELIFNDIQDNVPKKEMFCSSPNKRKQCYQNNNNNCINNYNRVLAFQNNKKINNVNNNKDIIINNYSASQLPYKFLSNNEKKREKENNDFVKNTNDNLNKIIKNTVGKIIKSNNVTNLFNNNIIILNNTNANMENNNNNYIFNKNSANDINIMKDYKKNNSENYDKFININIIENNKIYPLNNISNNNSKLKYGMLNLEESSIPITQNYYTIDAVKNINDENFSNKLMDKPELLNFKSISISQNISNKKNTNTTIKKTNSSAKKYMDKKSFSIDKLRKKNSCFNNNNNYYVNNFNKKNNNLNKQQTKIIDKINANNVKNINNRYSKVDCDLLNTYYEVINEINNNNLKEKFTEKENRTLSAQKKTNKDGNIKNRYYSTYDMDEVDDNMNIDESYFNKHFKNIENIEINSLSSNYSNKNFMGKNPNYSAKKTNVNINRSLSSKNCNNNVKKSNNLLRNKTVNNYIRSFEKQRQVNNNCKSVKYNYNTISNNSHRNYLPSKNNVNSNNKKLEYVRNNSSCNQRIKYLNIKSDGNILFNDNNINNKMLNDNLYNITETDSNTNLIENSNNKEFNIIHQNKNIAKISENFKQYYKEYYNNYLNDLQPKNSQKYNNMNQNKQPLNKFIISNIDNNMFNNNVNNKMFCERANMYNKKNERIYTQEPLKESYSFKGNNYNHYNKFMTRSNIRIENGGPAREISIKNFLINKFNNNDPNIIIQNKME